MKSSRTRRLLTDAAIGSLMLTLLVSGCVRTVSKTEETRVNRNGSITTKEQTITENPDGSLNRTEVKKTSRP